MTTVALVALAKVKEWLAPSSAQPFPDSSNGLLGRLVGAASAFAIQYLQRPVVPATFSEIYNGNDQRILPLRQRPVILVRSLTIVTTAIAARAQPGSFGFVADNQSVYLDGCSSINWGAYGVFVRGVQNIAITYDAGYQQADAWSVPSAVAPATLPAVDTADLLRPWNSDRGVAYATGAAFTLVTTAPTSAGTYQLTTDVQGNTQYVFATADVGASIVITYGYTPEDVAQAIVELVGERYKARGRIGETSHAVGPNQNVSFSQRDMSPAIKAMLNPYRNVVPIS